jgi:hypothetical protein
MQMTRGSTIRNDSNCLRGSVAWIVFNFNIQFIGIGVGGSAEKAMLMAKESLMESIDIQDIAQKPNPSHLLLSVSRLIFLYLEVSISKSGYTLMSTTGNCATPKPSSERSSSGSEW